MDQITVACVLRSGGVYRPSHVYALAEGVRRNLTLPHRIVCLTDFDLADNIQAIPLPKAWPGWWAKLCLFAPGLLRGPVFYLDLDTVIWGSLDDVVTGHRFTMLQNFWRRDPGRVGSGLMAWNCDLSHIYCKFSERASDYIEEYQTPDKWGDQQFIFDHTPVYPERFQTLVPGKVVSYKMHCAHRVPRGAAVVCFHGKPKPWEVTLR